MIELNNTTKLLSSYINKVKEDWMLNIIKNNIDPEFVNTFECYYMVGDFKSISNLLESYSFRTVQQRDKFNPNKSLTSLYEYDKLVSTLEIEYSNEENKISIEMSVK